MTTIDPAVQALLKDPAALIPAIVQDISSNEVLMLAYMNAESLALTLSTAKQHIGAAVVTSSGLRAQHLDTSKKCIQFHWIVTEMRFCLRLHKLELHAIRGIAPVFTPHLN